MPASLKRQKRVSWRQIAQHNSYYATELIKSKRQVARLTERIKELEKEKVLCIEQVVKSNKRADGILQFGFEEETIKADIKKLQNERDRLDCQVVRLEEVIKKIKYNIHQMRKRN